MRRNALQTVVLIACLICAGLALLPGAAWLVREGMLTTAAALWFVRVELRRSRQAQGDLVQAGVLLVLGLLLWKVGNPPAVPEYIWGAESARGAMANLFALTLGVLVVPACLCFYFCMPERRTVRRKATMKRPASVVLTEYRAAM